jgi:Leucine-rich repeat (LRR) protein
MITTTEGTGSTAWIMLDLGFAPTISSLTITGRLYNYLSESNNIEIRIGNSADVGGTGNAICATSVNAAAATRTVNCAGTGRYLTFDRLTFGYLSLCEIEAYISSTLSDGSFDDSLIPTGYSSVMLQSGFAWSCVGSCTRMLTGTGGDWNNLAAADGSQYLAMLNSVSLQQQLSNLQVGQVYQLTWKFMKQPLPLTSTSNSLQVYLDGSSVFYEGNVSNTNSWSSASVTFTARSSSPMLLFQTINPSSGNNFVLLDHIDASSLGYNVALLQTASSSGLSGGSSASTALNGIETCGASASEYTVVADGNWWMVDLGYSYNVRYVVVTGSTASPALSQDLRVRIGDSNVGGGLSNTICAASINPGSSKAVVLCSGSGRYVTFDRTSSGIFSLCEVQVLGTLANVALSAQVSQSSNFNGANSSLAVDGSTICDAPDGAGMIMTSSGSGSAPWYMVDLGGPYTISSVILTGRAAAIAQSSNLQIRVGSSDVNGGVSNAVCATNVNSQASPYNTAPVSCLATGRFVSIFRLTNNYLSICEVQVIGIYNSGGTALPTSSPTTAPSASPTNAPTSPTVGQAVELGIHGMLPWGLQTSLDSFVDVTARHIWWFSGSEYGGNTNGQTVTFVYYYHNTGSSLSANFSFVGEPGLQIYLNNVLVSSNSGFSSVTPRIVEVTLPAGTNKIHCIATLNSAVGNFLMTAVDSNLNVLFNTNSQWKYCALGAACTAMSTPYTLSPTSAPTMSPMVTGSALTDTQGIVCFRDNIDPTKLWSTSLSGPCSGEWSGVVCSGGSVRKLNLASKNLRGNIAFALDCLARSPLANTLETLLLNDNSITGSIPSFLGTMFVRLNRVDLSNNQLSGGLPSLAGLSSLISLSAANNQLSGSLPVSGFPPNLYYLNLENNMLSGQIPSFAAVNIYELRLNDNQFSGSFPDLGVSTYLRRLHLFNNAITGVVPSLLSKTNLQVLRLYNNAFSGAFPSCANLASLQQVWVQNNQFSGSLPAFTGCTSLWTLYIQDNKFSGTIPDFSGLSLRQLSAYNNKFSGSLPAFSTAFLGTLDVHGNLLSGSDLNFGTYTNLLYLDISNNQFSGSLPVLPSSLLYFFGQSNRFSGSVALGTSYCSASSNLYYLDLSFNLLSSSLPTFANPKLVKLILTNNSLTGSFPSFDACLKLQYLSIANNLLSGAAPRFSSPSSGDLRALDLSGNRKYFALHFFNSLHFQ